MALERFKKDMKIIAALDDEPNDVGGLTADELKEKFDEGGEALKEYINSKLLPALEAAGVLNSVPNTRKINWKSLSQDIVLDADDVRAISITGGDINGNLGASGTLYAYTGISTPGLASVGSLTVEGNTTFRAGKTISLSGSRLQGVGVPVADTDAARIVDVVTATSGLVPKTTRINGKVLSGDVTLGAADVGALPAAKKGTPGGVAELDDEGKVPMGQLPAGNIYGDIDCGTFEDGTGPVPQHNVTPMAHPLLMVDGNATEVSESAETLEEHIADPLAHQNIYLDGNMN